MDRWQAYRITAPAHGNPRLESGLPRNAASSSEMGALEPARSASTEQQGRPRSADSQWKKNEMLGFGSEPIGLLGKPASPSGSFRQLREAFRHASKPFRRAHEASAAKTKLP